MLVRPLTEADADAYRQLRIASIDEAPCVSCPGIVRELALHAHGRCALTVHAREGGRIWGAFDAGRLVGAVAVSRQPAPGPAEAEAWGLYVTPERRGNGVAAAMMLYLLRWCRQQPGMDRILVHVGKGNRRAIRWFARIGFKPCDDEGEGGPPRLLTLCWRLAPPAGRPARRDRIGGGRAPDGAGERGRVPA